ncbi:unnamed protein product [Rhizoctonia solani]|uniref:Arrestin-like N-terminal domain-containing protein n=1 Tax=Rhizoctonia solani TaxID=456999 RepID=A0A8H3AXT9_9AGAM|nr:unnamed protein product [Rhizoctonia solani]
MAAPCYTDSGYSAPTSPPYSASVTDGERILELRPSLSTLPTNLPDQYMFQSQRIKLDLGARIWPTRTPCFGYTSAVEGRVSVTSLEHVKRLTVTVEAMVKSSFMERGVLAGHIESTIFQRAVTLYTNSPRSAEATLHYPFSISLPTTCDKGMNPLPPSFVCYLPGVSAEVRYRIRIDMSRSGLRRRESLIVPILYLPRSYTPETPRGIPLFNDQASLLSRGQDMQELHLTPKSILGPKKANKSKGLSTADVQAKISLPSPLVAASGERIPFIITIYSQSQALAALYTDISLQLIKVTRIKAYEKTSLKEVILAAGEVYDSEELGNGVQVLRGELGNGVPGTELSWLAAGVVEVRHVIRLSIKPPTCTTALSTNLPMFEGVVAVEILTHRYTPEFDPTVPALGMIGINAI